MIKNIFRNKNLVKNSVILKIAYVGLILFLLKPFSLEAQIDNEKTFVSYLDNGMTVVLKENHSAPIAAIHIYVKTGSIYEGKFLGCGISHYFEHIMAGGTTKYHQEEYYNEQKQKIGAEYNAYTTYDHTCYHIEADSKFLDEMLTMLSEWITGCAFDSSEVSREKGVIQKEILMGETPNQKFWQLIDKTVYGVHPRSHPIIGYIELFNNLSHKDILDYYQKFYVPNNMVFVAVGDFNADKVYEKIKDVFKSFKRGNLDKPTLPPKPEQISQRETEIKIPISYPKLFLGYHTVTLFSPELYTLDLLSVILGQGDSARLPRLLKDEKQLVNFVRTWSNTPNYVNGELAIVCEPKKKEDISCIINLIRDELENIKIHGVAKSELERAKKQKLAEKFLSTQSIGSQAFTIGTDMISAGDPDFQELYYSNIVKVTDADLKAVSRKYCNTDNEILVKVIPEAKDSSINNEKIEDVKSKSPIVYKQTLKNGMKLLYRENSTFPTISIRLKMLGGILDEDEKNNGVTNFMCQMLLKGTKKYSAKDIENVVDNLGAEVNASCDEDYLEIGMDCLSEDIEKMLQFLAEILINPVFPDEEIEKVRSEILAGISREQDHPFPLSLRFFKEKLYGNHPYRFSVRGTVESVKSIEREQIVAAYQRYVKPDNAVLAVFGDVDIDKLPEMIEKIFDKFRGTTSGIKSKKMLAPINFLNTNETFYQTYPHSQVNILWGFPTIDKNDPALCSLKLISNIFSGNNSRLHKALRGERDLVYFAYGYQQTSYEPSSFVISTQTAAEKKDEVIAVLKDEVTRLMNNFLTQEELENNKQEISNSYQLHNETNSERADRASFYEIMGLGYEYFDNYIENIKKVTAEDIQKVAKKYFAHSVMTISQPDSSNKDGKK